MTLNESHIESAALEWFADLGYAVLFGPDIAPDMSQAERASHEDVVLVDRLRSAMHRSNPTAREEVIEEALRKVLRTETMSLTESNRRFHAMLRDGVTVESRRADGTISGETIYLIDANNIAANDFLAVNQFTVVDAGKNRRPDVVIFVNGLPLATPRRPSINCRRISRRSRR